MKCLILGCGTSTGVPIPGCSCEVCQSSNSGNKRSRSSVLITTDSGKNILIDAGPDLRYQALANNINHLSSVIFTHGHADHILGIDDLRGFNFVQQGAEIPCYASQHTLEKIMACFAYIVEPHPEYEGGMLARVAFSIIEPYLPFSVSGIEVLPILLKHGSSDVLGFVVGELVYATDCNHLPQKTQEIIKGKKYLLLDGLRDTPHSTHFSIPEAVAMGQKLEVENLILTHMTHSVDYDKTNKQLPTNTELAYDGMVIEFKGYTRRQ